MDNENNNQNNNDTILPSCAKHVCNSPEQTDENNIIIRNIDLFCKFYSEKVLINNIKNISRYDVLRTQPRLSKEFIDNYILTDDDDDDDDDDITIETLYNYQPYYFVNK
jgi:hypothetical protein